jgi:Zn-dependent protease with chaperone function
MIPITLSSNILLDLLGKTFLLSGILLLLLLLVRFLKVGSSDTRAKIFLVLLFLPMFLFLTYIAIIERFALLDCSIFSLCQTALHIPSRLFGPLRGVEIVNAGFLALVGLVALVGAKQLLGFLLGRRFLSRFEVIAGEPYEKAHRVLADITEKADVRSVELNVCRFNHPIALTTGFFRPRILVSSWLIDALDQQELEAVIAHEVAHIRRRDNLINSVAGLAKDILFFLPSSYPAWYSYLQEREKACDDLTVSITERPLALASALLKVGKMQVQSSLIDRIADPVSPGLSRGASTIQERIKRLVSYPDSAKRSSVVNCIFSFTIGFLILGTTFMPALSWQKTDTVNRPDYCCSSMQSSICPDSNCSP